MRKHSFEAKDLLTKSEMYEIKAGETLSGSNDVACTMCTTCVACTNMAKLKLRDIQISIDTFIEEHLEASLGVKNGYVEKIKSTLQMLDECGIHIMVHSVLTQKNESIEEIWNSERANPIYYIKQSDIPKDSLCSSCQEFKMCRENRQVCYREIIKRYGADKWYYPDVKCPYVNGDGNKTVEV